MRPPVSGAVLDGRAITVAELVQTLARADQGLEWTPPPRFREKRFSNYRIDPHIHGQAAAVAEVKAFASRPPRRGLSAWWRRKEARGCYLDGGFGVGKTHLLASAWHAAPGSKSYISFAEAMNLIVRQGIEPAIASLAADLVCIDEFELDDPSNTRMADLLCHGLVQRRARLLVTSNTVPGELGVGRLFVDQFRAQLVRISEVFHDVHVPGRDYRQQQHGAGQRPPRRWLPDLEAASGPRRLLITAATLNHLLQEVPVVHLRALSQLLDHMSILDLDTFADQLPALRFVNLIDRVYDQRISLSVRAHCAVDDLFHPDYRDWAFGKKYRRCCSRLRESCDEEVNHGLSD